MRGLVALLPSEKKVSKTKACVCKVDLSRHFNSNFIQDLIHYCLALLLVAFFTKCVIESLSHCPKK